MPLTVLTVLVQLGSHTVFLLSRGLGRRFFLDNAPAAPLMAGIQDEVSCYRDLYEREGLQGVVDSLL